MWNINGLNATKICGLQRYIRKYDITMLCETWLKESPDYNIEYKNYNCYNKSRKLRSKRVKRASGGLLVYYKSELQKNIEFIESPGCDDLLRIKLNSEYMATENDLYICLCYIIPDGSTTLSYMDKAWQTLQQDIAKYSQLGKIILNR